MQTKERIKFAARMAEITTGEDYRGLNPDLEWGHLKLL